MLLSIIPVNELISASIVIPILKTYMYPYLKQNMEDYYENSCYLRSIF